MVFFLFLLCVALFFIYTNLSNLKKEVNTIKDDLEKINTQNRLLKLEIERLKSTLLDKQSAKSDLLVTEKIENSTLITEIIKSIEPELTEDVKSIEINTKENSADFIAINDIPVAKQSITYISELIIEAIPEEKNNVFATELQNEQLEKPEVYTDPKIEKESDFSILLKKIEIQFAENWTGILGTAIMVLGIGYLSIYTAMKVSPMFRILLIWLYAGLLFGSYYLLKKKEKWEKTALWLRSAGASLFLFACFGASQIEVLKFISSTTAAYFLLSLGISLNLFIGYSIKKQSFLSLHVVLGLLVLCVVPDKMLITFILAALTATAGIILSYKEKWEYHLLTVISAFIIFDIWFNSNLISLSKLENIFAILGIILVFASCLLMQYRSIYENTKFEKSAFITHLANWILFATGLIMHSTGNHFKTFVIMIGAVVCFFMALQARKKKIVWLYHLDGLVSFILLCISVILLNDWSVSYDIILCILYAITLVCLLVVYKEKELLLHKLFLLINHSIALFTVGFIIFESILVLPIDQLSSAVITALILSLTTVSFTIYTIVKKIPSEIESFYLNKKYPINGLVSIVFSIFSIIIWNKAVGNNSYFYVLISFALLWAFLKQKFNTTIFDLGRILFLLVSFVCGTIIIASNKKSFLDGLFILLLLCVFIYNWKLKLFLETEFVPRFLVILGTNIIMSTLVIKYTNSTVVTIFCLSVIALFNHEFLWYQFKKKALSSKNQIVLYLFYYLFISLATITLLFNLDHLTTIQNMFTCCGIVLFETYILFAPRFKNKNKELTQPWATFNFWNAELILITLFILVFNNFLIEYTASIFAALSVILFFGFKNYNEFKRYLNYSFLTLALSSLITVVLSISEFETKSKTILYGTQIASVLFGILYGYFSHKETIKKSDKLLLYTVYLINFWIITLIIVQVQLVYLSAFLMVLALINYYLISNHKIKLQFHAIVVLGAAAILLSLFFSFYKLNSFTTLDWILQLSSVAVALFLSLLIHKNNNKNEPIYEYQIILNSWLSVIMFSQLPHKWLPVYWIIMAILNIYLYKQQIIKHKKITILYYLLANIHLAFISFSVYQSKYLVIYLLIFALLATYIYLAYKWLENSKFKNSILVYPATLSIACFLFLTFDKGILTFFWILESLALLILSLALKEKYFRYVSLSFVAICVVRLLFFDLSNADFLVRALVLLGVGIVLILMNTLFKKYKNRFE